jgi:hypothetical protein
MPARTALQILVDRKERVPSIEAEGKSGEGRSFPSAEVSVAPFLPWHSLETGESFHENNKRGPEGPCF